MTVKFLPIAVFTSVVANVIAVFSLPLYSRSHLSSVSPGPFQSTATLFQVLTGGARWFHLIFPLLAALVIASPFNFPVWRPMRYGALIAFWTYCVLGGFSIGIFYLPSAVLLTWVVRSGADVEQGSSVRQLGARPRPGASR
ncbi:MAG: hypothetical protein ABI811_07700 [Acidobacteriota bacterium]